MKPPWLTAPSQTPSQTEPHFWATLDADSIRPYLPDLPVLLPVASFQRRDFLLRRPPQLSSRTAPVAIDTGAFAWFQAHCMYHFSGAQLCEWIAGVHPHVEWAVIPDRPTEDLAGPREVRQAQNDTTEAIAYFLSSFLEVPWSWVL